MNASSPDQQELPERDPHPLERRLQRLQPQPLTLSAESILAAAENGAPDSVPADQHAPRPVVPVPATTALHPWSLAAVGISGFAVGILLTYVVMSRTIESTAPPVVISTQSPDQRVAPAPVTTPEATTASPLDVPAPGDTPAVAMANVAAKLPTPRPHDPWQLWLDASQTRFNAETILAVRGSRPRNDLVGLSHSSSHFERRSTPILQPTLHRGMGMHAGSTPNDILDELLGPL